MDDLFETLKYNVEIDQESLASQLENVKNQIDLTMGSLAFNTDQTPQATDVTSLSGGIYAATDVQGALSNPNLNVEANPILNTMGASLDSSAQNIRLGSSRFNEDMRTMGLLASPPNRPSYASAVPNSLPDSFFGNLLGIAKIGYDRDESLMSLSDWERGVAQNLSNSTGQFATNNSFAVGGAVLGSVGGFWGAVSGYTIGSLADMTAGTLLSYAKERESLSTGMRGMAALNGLGSISQAEARNMATIMQEGAYSFQNRAIGKDIERLQENVLGFDAAGGFSQVTSSEEMSQVLEGVVENTRQFANTFKMKQEEAVQVMAELQKSLVVSMDSLGGFASRMGYVGDVTGMSASDATDFGMQGVQMLRGTGISASQRFDMAIESRMQAEQLRFADPITRQLVNDAGGTDAFALRQLESTNRWAMSGQGMLNSAALLGGTEMGGSLSQIIGGAANYLAGDPNAILELQANMGTMAGAIGFNNLNAMSVAQAYNLMDITGVTGPNGEISKGALAARYASMTGVGQDTALGAVNNFMTYAQSDPDAQQVSQLIRGISDIAEANSTTIFERTDARVEDFFEWAAVGMANQAGLTNLFTAAVDGSRGLRTDITDWFSGTRTLDGINLSEGGRRAYNRLRAEGTFSEEFTNEELSETRWRLANEVFSSAIEDPGPRNSNYFHLRNNIFAGMDRLEKGSNSLGLLKRLNRGDISGEDFVALRDRFNPGVDHRNFLNSEKSDLVPGDPMSSVESILAEEGIDYNQATDDQLSGAIQRYAILSGDDSLIEGLTNSIGGKNKILAEARSDRTKEAISGLESSRGNLVKDIIKSADIASGTNGSFSSLFSGVSGIQVRQAIKRGNVSELTGDGSELSTAQQDYLIRASEQGGFGSLGTIGNEIQAWEAYGQNAERASDIINNLGLGSYSRYAKIFANKAASQSDQLSKSNLNSMSVIDMSRQGGGAKGIRNALAAAGFSEGDITSHMDELEDASLTDQLEIFEKIASKIGNDSVFRAGVDKMDNVQARGNLLDAMGTSDSVEGVLNRVVSDDAFRIKIVDSDGVPIPPHEEGWWQRWR